MVYANYLELSQLGSGTSFAYPFSYDFGALGARGNGTSHSPPGPPPPPDHHDSACFVEPMVRERSLGKTNLEGVTATLKSPLPFVRVMRMREMPCLSPSIAAGDPRTQHAHIVGRARTRRYLDRISLSPRTFSPPIPSFTRTHTTKKKPKTISTHRLRRKERRL
jgi:hypothetical protein